MDIKDTAAIITGGASGLGEATARHLCALGAQVTLLDRDAERGSAVATENRRRFCPDRCHRRGFGLRRHGRGPCPDGAHHRRRELRRDCPCGQDAGPGRAA